jgi:hypothetical protein
MMIKLDEGEAALTYVKVLLMSRNKKINKEQQGCAEEAPRCFWASELVFMFRNLVKLPFSIYNRTHCTLESVLLRWIGY